MSQKWLIIHFGKSDIYHLFILLDNFQLYLKVNLTKLRANKVNSGRDKF